MKDFDYKRIQVESYSGYKLNERPVAFLYGGERREIDEIVDRWYEGSMEGDRDIIYYFEVKTKDGDVFFLRYEVESGAWSLREEF